jgi:hypothetical protein
VPDFRTPKHIRGTCVNVGFVRQVILKAVHMKTLCSGTPCNLAERYDVSVSHDRKHEDAVYWDAVELINWST